MYRRIVVPLDGSPLSEAALDQLPNLVDRHTEVFLIRVVPPPDLTLPAPIATNPTSLSVLAPSVDVALEEARAELGIAEQYLAERETDLASRGIRAHSIAIVDPSPATIIVEQAEVEQADLIVMSTHGRSGIVKWVLGSVADNVLHTSPVPLLLVRPARPVR